MSMKFVALSALDGLSVWVLPSETTDIEIINLISALNLSPDVDYAEEDHVAHICM